MSKSSPFFFKDCYFLHNYNVPLFYLSVFWRNGGAYFSLIVITSSAISSYEIALGSLLYRIFRISISRSSSVVNGSFTLTHFAIIA